MAVAVKERIDTRERALVLERRLTPTTPMQNRYSESFREFVLQTGLEVLYKPFVLAVPVRGSQEPKTYVPDFVFNDLFVGGRGVFLDTTTKPTIDYIEKLSTIRDVYRPYIIVASPSAEVIGRDGKPASKDLLPYVDEHWGIDRVYERTDQHAIKVLTNLAELMSEGRLGFPTLMEVMMNVPHVTLSAVNDSERSAKHAGTTKTHMPAFLQNSNGDLSPDALSKAALAIVAASRFGPDTEISYAKNAREGAIPYAESFRAALLGSGMTVLYKPMLIPVHIHGQTAWCKPDFLINSRRIGGRGIMLDTMTKITRDYLEKAAAIRRDYNPYMILASPHPQRKIESGLGVSLDRYFDEIWHFERHDHAAIVAKLRGLGRRSSPDPTSGGFALELVTKLAKTASASVADANLEAVIRH